MILPRVKEQTVKNGLCNIPSKITYSYNAANEESLIAAKAFASFVCESQPSASDAFVQFSLDNTLEGKEEIYHIEISADKICVSFRDKRGAVNGAASAALILRNKTIPQCTVTDYPSCEYRSLMIDMARGLPEKKDIENAVKYMALAKYNRLHLHLIDSKGPCYKSEVLPEYKFIGKGKQCDKSFLRDIISLCNSYAIEIIPEIEVPAHADALCKAHPEFKCTVDNAHEWVICPGNNEIWEFFDKLIGEIADIFKDSRYIHVGSDELEFLDIEKPRICHWDECPRCAELREREGLSDKRDEFYFVMEKLHQMILSRNKKMIMWNDQIDISRDVPLSRDILIQFWRIAAKGRGPYEGCVFEKFLEKGFTAINSYYPQTYFDVESYMSSEKLKKWTPYNIPEQSGKYTDRVLGGEACAWEYGNYENYPFYGCVTPPVIATFGDKLWGLGEIDYSKEYKNALAEFIFGSKDFAEIFTFTGDVIPPRSKSVLTYADTSEISHEAITSCIKRLKENSQCPVSDKYAELLTEIAKAVH